MISAVVNQHFESGDACVSDYVAVYDRMLLLIKALFTHVPSVVILMERFMQKLPAHHVKITQIIMIIVTTHTLKQNQNTLHKDH